MTEALILELDEISFDGETFDSSGPVLVFMGAERRCAVCRRLYPLVEKVADKYSGKLEVRKVDVDRCPGLASRFRLKGIPTMLLFQEGVVEDRLGGFQESASIESFLDKYLAKK
jgi:thioredoxin 1